MEVLQDFIKTGGALTAVLKSLGATENADPSTVVEKSYVAPSTNYGLTNQNVGGLLPVDQATLFVNTIIAQDMFLRGIRKVKTNALVKRININNIAGKLVQVEEGVAPSSSQYATTNNIGYDVYLQSMQFFYRLVNEELAAYAQFPEYKAEKMGEVAREFANQLTKLALTGVATTTSNLDIKAYHWITGTTFEAAPYIGVSGILERIDNGYTYTESGSTKNGTVGARVATTADGTTFKTVYATLKELIPLYPNKYNDKAKVKFFMSPADLFALQVEMVESKNNTDLRRVENGDVWYFMGYECVPVPQLESISKVTTISTVKYFPGAILMGAWEDMMMVENLTTVSVAEEYQPLERQYVHVTDIKVAFGAIPQKFGIACYRPTRT